MTFYNSVPILYSSNILKSLDYYTKSLQFDTRWDWGEPPTFGGVGKDSIQIFFCEGGQGNPGTWLSIFVDDVDEYYNAIKPKGAKIISEPDDKIWGVREMLVGDPDGHIIRFGHGISFKKKSESTIPQTVRIVARIPAAKELNQLAASVGWGSETEGLLKELPTPAIEYAVVAEETTSGKIIGCAFLLGDGAGFYYVKNVIVHPDWQGKRVGSALMKEITKWLDEHAPDKALVGLHTGETLTNFYKQFGFVPAFSMTRHIKRDKQEK